MSKLINKVLETGYEIKENSKEKVVLKGVDAKEGYLITIDNKGLRKTYNVLGVETITYVTPLEISLANELLNNREEMNSCES